MKLFKHSNGFFRLLAGLGLMLGGLITGCAGGAGSGGATQTGTVAVLLTDAPSDEYSEFNVTVNQVSLLADGQEPVVLFSGSRRINLLELEEVEDLFMIHDGVPAGVYNKIRFHVSDPEFVTFQDVHITGSQINLVENGIVTFDLPSPLRLLAGEIQTIRIDLDIDHSIILLQGSTLNFGFQPVVIVQFFAGLPPRLVRVNGVIEENSIDPTTRSFLLKRSDPIFRNLSSGDDNQSRLIRVIVPDDAHIFKANGEPGSFSDLHDNDPVHVRGLLSLDGNGFYISAKLIQIGQFAFVHGLIITDFDPDQNHFRMRPDGCLADNCEIDVQVHSKTLIFDAITHNELNPTDLVAGKRVIIVGIRDVSQDPDLLHAAVIVVKPSLTRLEGKVLNPDTDTHRFTLVRQSDSDVLVHVIDGAVIIRISHVTGDGFQIEPYPFGSLVDNDPVQVLGRFDELGTPFHALEVITFATQPIP